MNWKRGLFRLWVIASIAWMVSAFIAIDAPEKINYAWRYYTGDSGLQKEQAVVAQDETQQTGAAHESITVVDDNPDELARQKRIAKILNVPVTAIQADPAFATQEQKIRQQAAANAADSLDALMDAHDEAKRIAGHSGVPIESASRKHTDSDWAELSNPEPEWRWLAVMLLPPTLGVAVTWVLLLGVFRTGRWIWLGFKSARSE